MKSKFTRILSGELLFFVAYGLFLFFTILATSFYYRFFHGLPFQIMYVVCVALLIVREIPHIREYKNHIVAIVLCLILFTISFLVADGALQRSIPCIFLFTFCARNISFRKIASFTLILGMTLLAFIIFSGYVGLLPNHTTLRFGREREYLGFRYALFPAAHLLNFTTLWIWLNRRKMPLPGVAFWGVLNLWMFIKTDSRLSFALSMFLLLTGLVMRYYPQLVDKAVNVLRWLLVEAFAISSFVAIGATALFRCRDPFMQKVNSFVSGRLMLGLRSLKNYGIRLFGQNLDWNGNSLDAFGNPRSGRYDYVDSLYVKILQKYGIVFIVVVIILLTLAMFKALQKKQNLILIILTTIALHCILDDLSSYLYYNTFWFAAAQLLMNPDILDEKPEDIKPILDYDKIRKRIKEIMPLKN